MHGFGADKFGRLTAKLPHHWMWVVNLSGREGSMLKDRHITHLRRAHQLMRV